MLGERAQLLPIASKVSMLERKESLMGQLGKMGMPYFDSTRPGDLEESSQGCLPFKEDSLGQAEVYILHHKWAKKTGFILGETYDFLKGGV